MSSISFTPFGLIQSFTYPKKTQGVGTSQQKHQNQTSVSSQIDQTTLVNNVEKHLDDVRAGLPGLSSSTYFNIVDSYTELNQTLSQTDPKSLKALSALMTSFSYGDAARSAVQLNFATKTLSQIPTEEESKALEDEILKAYGKKPVESDTQVDESVSSEQKIVTVQDAIIDAGKSIQNGEKISKTVNDALGAYRFAEQYVKDDEQNPS